MATTAPESGRIAALDIVRGVAVMGILAMNIVAFALPMAAYMNPLAYGSESTIDFDRQLSLCEIEIQDVGPDGMLSPNSDRARL